MIIGGRLKVYVAGTIGVDSNMCGRYLCNSMPIFHSTNSKWPRTIFVCESEGEQGSQTRGSKSSRSAYDLDPRLCDPCSRGRVRSQQLQNPLTSSIVLSSTHGIIQTLWPRVSLVGGIMRVRLFWHIKLLEIRRWNTRRGLYNVGCWGSSPLSPGAYLYSISPS